jgi:UDP-N-acetylglucosamine 2-epimerase (non-hydrolysing)
MAPVHKALQKYKNKVIHKILHTGQHFDDNMSAIFFRQLNLPKPHIHLETESKSPTEQTAEIMVKLEKVLIKEKPDLVMVYGDVNSTLAASVVCSKILLHDKPIPIAHIESGLRSFDLTMPEEINRMVTDTLSKYLFITEQSGIDNLLKAGVPRQSIFFVGNTMIDSLVSYIRQAKKSSIIKELCITNKNYVLVTLHRPSNVDNLKNFRKVIDIFRYQNNINSDTEIVFPIHPRTIKMMKKFKLEKDLFSIKNLIITEPLGYFDFLNLIINAKYIMTDSGGIQEESTYLKVPCLTLRENTERPVTSIIGTNTICGLNSKLIFSEINKIEKGIYKKGKIPKYWDGKASERAAKIIVKKILK